MRLLAGTGNPFAPRQWMAWLALACTLWLTGCAQPPRAAESGTASWSGRLSLQVEGQASQSFSSLFYLQGNLHILHTFHNLQMRQFQ